MFGWNAYQEPNLHFALNRWNRNSTVRFEVPLDARSLTGQFIRRELNHDIAPHKFFRSKVSVGDSFQRALQCLGNARSGLMRWLRFPAFGQLLQCQNHARQRQRQGDKTKANHDTDLAIDAELLLSFSLQC